ncbi:MAG: PP2C family protein-serine/threonine phosphatase, partial [Sciscionella sp.]
MTTAKDSASHIAASDMVAAPLDSEGARATFLSEASRRLSGCLDVRRTLLSALRVVVPGLAGWAQIALFEPGVTTLVAREADPAQQPLTVESTAPRTAHTGLGRIARTGETTRLRLDTCLEQGGDPEALIAALVPEERLRAVTRALQPVDVLGVPLAARGTTFGALVLLRGPGAAFDEHELRLTEDVASRIAVAIDVAKIYEERAHMASVLQASLRPPVLPEVAGMRLAARYRAAVEHIEIGGDFFDVHGAGNDWTVVIGDVCGKGVEAAVLTGRSRQTVRAAAHMDRSPARALAVLN